MWKKSIILKTNIDPNAPNTSGISIIPVMGLILQYVLQK